MITQVSHEIDYHNPAPREEGPPGQATDDGAPPQTGKEVIEVEIGDGMVPGIAPNAPN